MKIFSILPRNNMILYILSSSFAFLLRRRIKKIPAEIDNIIVDMDRTLLKTNIGKEALIICHGKEKADEIEHTIMRKVANGMMSMSDAMYRVINYLVEGKFTHSDSNKIIERCISGEIIRHNLLDSLLKLQEKGKRIILATMSTQRTADWFVNKYGFFGGLGTIEEYNENGIMTGCSQIISEENKEVDGIKYRSKMYLIKEMFKERNIFFDETKTAIITDDVTDLHIMRDVFLAIFLILKEPTKIQKLCYRLKLYDCPLKENGDLEKLII
jgi:phosphoserine phosphatase